MQDELNGKRKVEVDLLCDRCGMEPESTIHVLKGCPWAGIWHLATLPISPSYSTDAGSQLLRLGEGDGEVS